MILRYDRVGIELPEGDPDPAGAMAVQELMGGRFGEMSTLMNYTFQSFNFRGRAKLRPFYDLIANIAAEEYGHIEVVGATINAMLCGTDGKDVVRHGQPAPRAQGRQGRAPGRRGRRAVDRRLRVLLRRPRRGPDPQLLPRDRRPQRQAKVYEMVDHPAARALTGYLLVRGGIHQVAYARALELITGADLTKTFPAPRIPTEKIPECKPHLDAGRT